MILVVIVLAAVGLVLAALTAYQTLFLLVGLGSLRRSRRAALPAQPRTRFVVIIPAHNEAGMIEVTVQSVVNCDYPAERRDVMVIADNCTDDTAARARLAGAICHERTDLVLRGKPHALDWMISRLDLSKYDGVVIVDADTVIDRQFLRVMDVRLAAGEQTIQSSIGVMNPDDNWLTRLGVVFVGLKFRLHYPGKRAFGLSCPLAGNGMCFSANLMRTFGWKAFSLTENWEYYVMLTLAGHVTTAASDAFVYGQVAKSLQLGETQRTRWMKGRVDTVRRYWSALLGQGLREPSLCKLDALVEVARPSHANLLVSTIVYTAAATVLWLVGLDGALLWAAVGAGSVILQAGYFVVGLAIERPPLRTWLALLMVPWYLLWKGVISLKGLGSLSERSWVKTTRN